LGPLDTPPVPAPGEGDECGAVGGLTIGRGNRSILRKPGPVPFCPPQIPRGLTWNRNLSLVDNHFIAENHLTLWNLGRY
jgi:hypothetical protein